MRTRDDAANVSHDERSLQFMMDRLQWACRLFSLTISVSKTVILVQDMAPNVTLNGVNLTVVNKFTYLGSVVASTVSHDEEIAGRIDKAATSFGRLRNRVWENNKLTIKSKMLVYESCFLSSLVYGSETWTLYAKQEKRLDVFQ